MVSTARALIHTTPTYAIVTLAGQEHNVTNTIIVTVISTIAMISRSVSVE